MFFLDMFNDICIDWTYFFMKTRRIFFFIETAFENPKLSYFDTVNKMVENRLFLIAYIIYPDDQTP